MVDLRVPWRQAQRIGRDLELRIERRRIRRGEDLLERFLLRRELVEIGVGLRVRGIDLVEALLRGEDFPQSLLDRCGR
jgi:hypothetical protein